MPGNPRPSKFTASATHRQHPSIVDAIVDSDLDDWTLPTEPAFTDEEIDAMHWPSGLLGSGGGRPCSGCYDPPMPPLVEDLCGALAEFPDIKLAVLFGSTACGKETPRSDLDLGVLLDPHDHKRLWPIDLAAGQVAKRTVDLIDLHTAPPLLRFEIARDGVVVVERDDYAWVDFKAKAMIDWWDWQPTARMIHRIMAEKLRKETAHGPA